jgi:DNA polymerase elongation subunit (family B)
MQHEVLAILAEAHDYDSYLEKLKTARGVFANYEDRLANGEVDIRELVVSKRITKEPRDYQKAGITAIAAQQLFGSGVKLRPGQNIEYVITNAEAHVPNDRVRAYALWEGWFGYDRKKYAAMLRDAFQPFQVFVAEPTQTDDSRAIQTGQDWADTPLFSALVLPLPPSRS